MQRSKDAYVGFAVAVSRESSGSSNWILMATTGIAVETRIVVVVVVGAAFCSVTFSEFCSEPGDEFGLAEFSVVFAGCIANFEDGILFEGLVKQGNNLPAKQCKVISSEIYGP